MIRQSGADGSMLIASFNIALTLASDETYITLFPTEVVLNTQKVLSFLCNFLISLYKTLDQFQQPVIAFRDEADSEALKAKLIFG
jgi:hypothetical protein